MTNQDVIIQAETVTEQIRPLLKGLDPKVQSVILADLTAAWMSGHVIHKDGAVSLDETNHVRSEVLANFVALVMRLVPFHHARIHGRLEGVFHDDRARDPDDSH